MAPHPLLLQGDPSFHFRIQNIERHCPGIEDQCMKFLDIESSSELTLRPSAQLQ